jgi:4-amino-4-deoxy-L-arabinose transferase-like glycosyltransferase
MPNVTTTLCPLKAPRWPLLWLLLCGLLLYGLGLASLPVTDRDEARFAQASKQMVETGDYVDIRFQETPRHKKPVGIYWLQSASVHGWQTLTGAPLNTIFPYRLPSFLGGLLAVLGFFALLRKPAGETVAFVASLLLAPCLLLVVEAHLAKTDAFLAGLAVLQQGALARLYAAFRGGDTQKDTRAFRLLFWLALGAGALVKGPVLPALALTTLLALRWLGRDKGFTSRFVRPFPWVLLPLLIVTPWLWAIIQKTGGAFLQESMGNDFSQKLLSGQESHGAWPGYYILLAPLLLWPSSLIILPALRHWRFIREQALARFALAWAVPFWLLLEIVPTKLPHYILPLVPPLCLLAALALCRHDALPAATGKIAALWRLWVRTGWGIGLVALAVALPALPLWRENTLVPLTFLGVFGILILGALVIRRSLDAGTFAAGILAAALVYGTAFGVTLPALKSVFASERICAAVGNRPLISVGYDEPSLVFRCGTGTTMTTLNAAFEALQMVPASVITLPQREEAAFQKLLAASSPALPHTRQHTLTFFNYNEGESSTLVLYAP